MRHAAFAAGTADQATTPGNADTTAWRHFALTYDTTDIRSYIDGVLQNTIASLTTRTTNTAGSGTSIIIAGAFQGHVADVACFDRVLTAAELLQLAEGRDARIISGGNLWGFYPCLFDGAGRDFSSRGNHATAFTGGAGSPPTADLESPPTPWARARAKPYIYIIAPPDVDFSGVITSPTAVTGSTAIRNQFSGAAASPSACSGTLQVRKFFTAAACSSTTSCAGTLAVRKLFSGDCTTPSACTGTLQSRQVFAGSCASPTACTGTLSLLGTVAFAGTVTSPTACTASANVRKPVSGAATSPTACTGSFNVRVNMSAAASSPSACTGGLQVRKFFAGLVTSPTACIGVQTGGTVINPVAPEDSRLTQKRRLLALNQFRRRGRM